MLVAHWIAATDQPFKATESPEFQALLSYLYNSAPSGDLDIPSWHKTRNRILKMGHDTINDLKKTFSV
jgi:hypothetical protein